MNIKLLAAPPSPDAIFIGYTPPRMSIPPLHLLRPPDPALSPTRITGKRKVPNEKSAQSTTTKHLRMLKQVPRIRTQHIDGNPAPLTDRDGNPASHIDGNPSRNIDNNLTHSSGGDLVSTLEHPFHDAVTESASTQTALPDDDVAASSVLYEIYVEAVLCDAVGFCQISPDIFVVQGWNSKSGVSTVSQQ
jgi:hypothetical protein